MGISLVITPACLYTPDRVYWVISMSRINWTPHLDHVILLSIIRISHSSVRLYCIDHIYSSVIIQFQHVINLVIASIYLNIKYIMFRILYLLLCLFSYILFMLYSILHSQYLWSTDAYVSYIFSWCRFTFSTSRSHLDRFSITSSAELMVSAHSPRTIVMKFF